MVTAWSSPLTPVNPLPLDLLLLVPCCAQLDSAVSCWLLYGICLVTLLLSNGMVLIVLYYSLHSNVADSVAEAVGRDSMIMMGQLHWGTKESGEPQSVLRLGVASRLKHYKMREGMMPGYLHECGGDLEKRRSGRQSWLPCGESK